MLPKHCKLLCQIAARPCPLSASSRPAHALKTVRPGWQAKPPTPWRCRWLDAIEPAAPCRAPLSQHGSCAVRSPVSVRRRALRRLDVSVRSSAAATHGGSDAYSSTGSAREGLGGLIDTVRREVSKLNGQWGKFIPMILLFFCCSVVNCVVDSLKDSLVITAVGGGASVIPFLTVYAVLPTSFLFLVIFSFASQRFSRGQLFNFIITVFVTWFVAFGFMYPHHEALHLHLLADGLEGWMPPGFAGGIGMIRNWLFTVFYVSSELWGDIVLSLLFWGLANETTTLQEAALLYPLFGVGANIGQAAAGKLLGLFTTRTAGYLTFAAQLQWTMGAMVAFGAAIIGLHRYITVKFPRQTLSDRVVQRAQQRAHHKAARPQTAAAPAGSSSDPDDTEALQERLGSSSEASTSESLDSAEEGAEEVTTIAAGKEGEEAPKMTVAEAFRFLIASKEVRCLALMAMSQGIATNLLEVAWKNHLHMLHPSPQAYAAFMGNVAMWTGIVTGSLMVCSPLIFERLGWRGVAGVTPHFMLLTGVPFFVGCVAWNWSPAMAGSLGLALLKFLVMSGAMLQVFGKGAKFSMFKPAEEMVYITLDEESRTKGKAAIDVVGAQSGKAISSMLQQVLLLLTSGAMAGTLPIMAVAYFFFVKQWSASVNVLADYQESVAYAAELSDSDDEEVGQVLGAEDLIYGAGGPHKTPLLEQ